MIGGGSPAILTPNSVSITAASQYVTQVESYSYQQSGIYFQAKVESGAPSFAPGIEYVSLGTTIYSGIIVGGNQIDLYGPAGYLGGATLNPGSIFSIYITPDTAYYYINGSLITSTSTEGSPTPQSIAIAGMINYPGGTGTVISNISIYSTGKNGTSGSSGSSGSSGTGSSGTSGTSGTSVAPTLYLLEATTASVTYTLPGSFTEDPCRYSIVSNTVNVSSGWFNTSTYTFTPQKAGYWEITAAYDVYRNSEAAMAIKKNNGIVVTAGSFGAVAQQITKIVYLNGSTDSIDIVNVGGAANSRSQYAERSWFQARWIGE
jgi:hypothetical protein